MDGPLKLLQQVRKKVQSVTYGSPLYRMMLDQGPTPERLRLAVTDLWPGDAKHGQSLIAAQPGLFDAEPTGDHQRRNFLAHEWLRDLRAVGSDMARRKAISLIHEWIEDQEGWDEESWAPDVLGARLANWIAFYEFYGPAASHDFERSLIVCMVRQLRHLLHTTPVHLTGIEGLRVVKGLIYGGLALIDSEKALSLALALLDRQIETEVLSDGGVVSRHPEYLADMLAALIDIRAALRLAQLEVPPNLALSIARMVPALKLLRHGDGCLAVFNGGHEGLALKLDAAITLSEAKGRVIKRLPQMAYERVTAGRSLLLMDVGGPPPRPFDEVAHAGLLAFEFSVGRERLIVNCGAGVEGDPEWRRAMGATAAHSTLTLGDTNACELMPDGGIGHRPREVVTQRYEQDDFEYVDAAHDGYAQRQRVRIQRSLGLAKDGDELKGREIIAGPPGRDFTIRWHLHPTINAMLAQGGGAALLRTPSGSGWKLRAHASAGDLAIESSIYCGKGPPRRTLQLRLTGRTRENPTIIEWSLVREKTKKGS